MQTEIAWKLAEQRGIPRAIFVNKLDRERASFSRTLDAAEGTFGAGVAPLQLPIGEEARVPRRRRSARTTSRSPTPAARRTGTEGADPRRDGDRGALGARRARRRHRRRRRRSHGALPRRREDRHRRARAARSPRASRRGTVFPVLCGSATKLIGIDRLAKFLVEEAPAPDASTTAQPGALVFKTIVDPYVGHVNLLQGAAGHGEARRRARRTPHSKADERMHQLFSMRGKEQDTVDRGRGGRHRRGRQAHRHDHRRRARREGHDASTSSRSTPPEPVLAVAIKAKIEGRRGQARQRAAPAPGRGPGAAHRAQPRDAPDRAARHGRDAPVDRAREARAQVRRRGRDRRRARRVPRDDQRHRRGRGQAQEADRRARPVRGRVAAGRAARSAAPATSSSTRSSAA